MHQQKNRQKNKFAIIVAILLVMVGAMAFFGFNFGYLGDMIGSFSPLMVIILIIGLMVIILIIGLMVGMSSRRNRMKKQHENRAVKAQNPYRQYEPPVMKREEVDITPEVNYKYKNSYEKQFCNFCGIKFETNEQTFCVNCGQRLN